MLDKRSTLLYYDMAHIDQIIFFKCVRKIRPESFRNVKVLDIGSLDINGSSRILFNDCTYTGLDLAAGKNVDVVCKAHEYDAPDESFDTIISSECFEHDMYLKKSLQNVVRLLKPGGLFTFSCASRNRPEHGTTEHDPGSSPFTSQLPKWCNYYRGLNEEDIREVIDVDQIFESVLFNLHDVDLYFYGIKKA